MWPPSTAAKSGEVPTPRLPQAIRILSMLSPLERRQVEALAQRALQHEEQEEDGHGGEHGNGHLLGRRVTVVVAEAHQAQRIRPELVPRHDHEGPEELVPAVAEGKQGKHGEGGSALGQDDRPEGAQLAGPVEPRRLEVVRRDLENELAHQEDAERVDEQRAGDALIAVDPAELVDDEECRDQRHLQRQHQRAEDHEEQKAVAGEAKLGEAVAGERAEDDVAEHHRRGDDGAVEEEPREGRARERVRVVLGMPDGGDPLRGELKHLLPGLERGGCHPDDGKDEQEGQGRQGSEPAPASGRLHQRAAAHEYSSSPRMKSRIWASVSTMTIAKSTTEIAAARPIFMYEKPVS